MSKVADSEPVGVGRQPRKIRTVADLADSPDNPRQITDEALAALGKSMERFGEGGRT
jgi:hypothetical protein